MKYLYIIFVFFLFSCSKREKNFKIINNTNNTIDSIKISSGRIEYKNTETISFIKQNDSVNIKLDLKHAGKDGVYYIEIFSNKIKRPKSFGYFSGSPSKNIFLINVKNDTIIINEKNEINKP